LREPRIERRSFDHDVFRRCFFLLFWLFFFCYLFLFFFCCYLFFFVLFITRIERERRELSFLSWVPVVGVSAHIRYNTNKLFVFIFYDFFPRACRSSNFVLWENIHTHSSPTPIRSFSLSLFFHLGEIVFTRKDRRIRTEERTNERTNAKRGKRDLRERRADYKKEKERGTGRCIFAGGSLPTDDPRA